jgi:hypothetical protein
MEINWIAHVKNIDLWIEINNEIGKMKMKMKKRNIHKREFII